MNIEIKIGTYLNKYGEAWGNIIRLGKLTDYDNIDRVLEHEIYHVILTEQGVNTFKQHNIIHRLMNGY